MNKEEQSVTEYIEALAHLLTESGCDPVRDTDENLAEILQKAGWRPFIIEHYD